MATRGTQKPTMRQKTLKTALFSQAQKGMKTKLIIVAGLLALSGYRPSAETTT